MSSDTYDSFEAWQRLKVQPFSFHSNRFEIWQNGEKTASGQTGCVVKASKQQVKAGTGAKVTLENTKPSDDKSLLKEIKKENVFDIFVTSSDRLQLVKIPSSGKGNENMGLSMLKMNIGTTRETFDFERKNPYCANLFLKDDNIVKVTFSFSNPEKLVELYSPEDDAMGDVESSYSELERLAERISQLRGD